MVGLKMNGVLIAFEGIDGSGKKTQSRLLKNELLKRGFRVRVYSYPDYNSTYGKIIKKFLDRDINLSVNEQFLLYLLDIVKDKEQIVQELREKNVVIVDRYFFSTIAYQCAKHFDYITAKEIVRLMDLPIPSVAFYLRIPVNVALRRKKEQKGIIDRFEEDIIFLENVKKFYEKLIKENFCSTKWVELNGLDKPEVIHDRVLSKVNKLIKLLCGLIILFTTL